MLRLKWLVQFANTENVTWDYTPVGYWSTLEVHVGIIIACLPALRSLQHRLLPGTKHPAAYYKGNSGAYGGYSKGGSPFPSIGGFKKSSQTTTQASQASMMRSRDRAKDDKEFIQLDEYEIRLDGPDVEKGERVGRGENRTQVRRGSLTNDDAVLLNNDGIAALPERRRISPSRADGLRVQVRREYSVDVEIAPDKPTSLSSSPPRVSEDDRVLPIQSNTNFSMKR
jgi:hypothetical protein